MWMFDAVENNGVFTRWQALAQLLGMFGLLGGVFYLSYLYDAPSRNPAVSEHHVVDVPVVGVPVVGVPVVCASGGCASGECAIVGCAVPLPPMYSTRQLY